MQKLGFYIEPEAMLAAELTDKEEYVIHVGRGTILISDGRECAEEQMIVELFLSLPVIRQAQLFQVLESLETYYGS